METPEIPKSRHYILLAPKTAPVLVESRISGVLNDRFSEGGPSTGSLLRITARIYPSDKDNKPIKDGPDLRWVIGSGNPDFLFGFMIITDGKRLTLKGSLNLWSQWALDYMRESLAERLTAKVCDDSNKVVKVDSSLIYDFGAWLKIVKPKDADFYHEYMARLPPEFAHIAGYKGKHS